MLTIVEKTKTMTISFNIRLRMMETPESTRQRPVADRNSVVTVQIGPPLLQSIIESARVSIPDECCGILLGRSSRRGAVVEQVRPAQNVNPSDRRRRYEIDPQVVFEALRAARKGGLEVVGFYHSHPEGAPSPSVIDADLAWPDKYYLIVGVGDPLDTGGARVRCWRPSTGGRQMVEVSVC
jgi:proteasome lid subunit RPN8/RPN11